jgi:translation initiation factor IF-2
MHHEMENKNVLAFVLKADTIGTEEAVITGLQSLSMEGVAVEALYIDMGDVNKTDLFMARSGSRLIEAFNVGLLPKVKETALEKGIEIHVHNVIYKLLEDVKEIARTLAPVEDEEKIMGRAKVIALFHGGHKGIILGCHVDDGRLSVGKKFRLISDPGTVYEGIIQSLHIGAQVVNEAVTGQEAGIRIDGFKRAKAGDLVECFETIPASRRQWQPRGGVFDMREVMGGGSHGKRGTRLSNGKGKHGQDPTDPQRNP